MQQTPRSAHSAPDHQNAATAALPVPALQVVPVPNATTAVNAVVRSMGLRQGDLVLITNATYPAVRRLRAW